MNAVKELLNNKIVSLEFELGAVEVRISEVKRQLEYLHSEHRDKTALINECILALQQLEETNGKIQE